MMRIVECHLGPRPHPADSSGAADALLATSIRNLVTAASSIFVVC